MERRVYPMHGALAPYDIAGAPVAMDSFLLSIASAMDSSEAHVDFKLFFPWFLARFRILYRQEVCLGN